MRTLRPASRALLGLLCLGSWTTSARAEPQLLTVEDELEAHLWYHEISRWFPASVDHERGGFHEHFDRDWQMLDAEPARSIVMQSRLVWTASAFVLHQPDGTDEFRTFARHGVEFLRASMWDRTHGGFHWNLDRELRPTPDARKHAYGLAFAIYGLAAAHEAGIDGEPLELAKQTFAWLDRHAHDAGHGGYFEALRADGTPVAPTASLDESDEIGTWLGRKSMNTHIHLLEAFTELYRHWPDETLRARLEEVFDIVARRIVVAPGTMHMHFEQDWSPLPGDVSYGHDVETAHLLLTAAKVLGRDDEAIRAKARSLVDHALHYGFDHELGGLRYEGTFRRAPHNGAFDWWVQAEMLLALAVMNEHFGDETDVYAVAFAKQWAFIRDKQTDHESGGWYQQLTPDAKPVLTHPKASNWKCPYHTSRALIETLKVLRRS